MKNLDNSTKREEFFLKVKEAIYEPKDISRKSEEIRVNNPKKCEKRTKFSESNKKIKYYFEQNIEKRIQWFYLSI